ncbi:unnamed protein product [Heterobilharzia americana]|nr:unnamed protein product [Heterobilharzia americana]
MKSPVSIYLISLSVFDILLLVCAVVLFFEYPFADDDSSLFPLLANNSMDSINYDTVNENSENTTSDVNMYEQLAVRSANDDKIISNITTAHRIYSLIQAHVVYPVALTAQTAAIWITSRLVVCCCMICAVVYNIPRWFEITTSQPVNSTELSKEPNFSQWSQQYDWHSLFRLVYYTWGYILVMFLLPLIALLVMNIRLMYALRRSDFAVHKSSQSTPYIVTSHGNESGSRNQLISCSSSFYPKTSTLSRKSSTKQFPIRFQRSDQSPSTGINIYFGIVSPKVLPHGWCALSELRNFLVVVNSSVNFIVYCVMGAKFRRSFIHVITPCWEIKLTNNNTQKTVVRLINLRSEGNEI